MDSSRSAGVPIKVARDSHPPAPVTVSSGCDSIKSFIHDQKFSMGARFQVGNLGGWPPSSLELGRNDDLRTIKKMGRKRCRLDANGELIWWQEMIDCAAICLVENSADTCETRARQAPGLLPPRLAFSKVSIQPGHNAHVTSSLCFLTCRINDRGRKPRRQTSSLFQALYERAPD